jgi:Ca2+-binding RTX toxin-like protein
MFTGANSARGSGASDTLLGGANSEFFEGRAGDDFINGGGGIDQVIYAFDGPVDRGLAVNLAAGTVSGDPLRTGTDTLVSVEAVRGSILNDVFDATGFFSGSNGSFNEFEGGAGDDTIIGNGNTRVSYLNAREAVTVNLALGSAAGGTSTGVDTLSGVNAVRGSNFADTLTGFNHGINTLHAFEGRGGDDFINGAGGADQAAYNNDLTFAGITVNMSWDADASTGRVVGDAQIGTDTITGITSVRGTSFVDVYDAVGFNSSVTGLGTFNEFDGGGGNDIVTGNGNTRITYINATSGVSVDLAGTATGDASVGSDTFTGVNQVRGSNFNDTLNGTLANETFEGRGGNDFISGNFGFDTARYDFAGGAGSFIWDGTGTITANVSLGGHGVDTLNGIEAIRATNFDDFFDVSAFAGGVRIEGNAGNDRFVSGAGDDFFHGGFVNDLQSVIGFTDSDRADYSAAASAVTVNLAAGTATGGGGNDTLLFIENVTGSAHDDLLIGSAQFFETFVGGAGNDTINGGAGTDRADYSGAAEGITAIMATGIVTGGPSVGTDTLIGVEQLFGTSFDDTYDATGAAFGNSFDPLGGDDNIIGNGNTRLSYSTAAEGVMVDLTAGTVTGGISVGSDTFSGVNSVRGSNFADTLSGGAANEFFEGRNGNDSINGGGGFDMAIYAFDGAVTTGIVVNLAAGTVAGDPLRSGTDTLSGIESVRGSFQGDFYDATGFSDLSANAGSFGTFNEFEGMAGNDVVIGNGTTRISYGSAREAVNVDLGMGTASGGASVGFDTFTGVNAVNGSNFDDVLRGSAGDDQLFGGNGNDVLYGGLGADFINLFGAGSDRVDFDQLDEAVDVVFNFDGLPGGDVLDIADLLDNSTSYADGAGGALEDFVQFAASDGNGLLNIDVDGAGNAAGWQTLASIQGGAGLTVNDLFVNGNLDIFS